MVEKPQEVVKNDQNPIKKDLSWKIKRNNKTHKNYFKKIRRCFLERFGNYQTKHVNCLRKVPIIDIPILHSLMNGKRVTKNMQNCKCKTMI